MWSLGILFCIKVPSENPFHLQLDPAYTILGMMPGTGWHLEGKVRVYVNLTLLPGCGKHYNRNEGEEKKNSIQGHLEEIVFELDFESMNWFSLITFLSLKSNRS